MLVTASGDLAFDAALRLLKQVCDTAAEKQVNKILVNSLAVRCGFFTQCATRSYVYPMQAGHFSGTTE